MFACFKEGVSAPCAHRAGHLNNYPAKGSILEVEGPTKAGGCSLVAVCYCGMLVLRAG